MGLTARDHQTAGFVRAPVVLARPLARRVKKNYLLSERRKENQQPRSHRAPHHHHHHPRKHTSTSGTRSCSVNTAVLVGCSCSSSARARRVPVRVECSCSLGARARPRARARRVLVLVLVLVLVECSCTSSARVRRTTSTNATSTSTRTSTSRGGLQNPNNHRSFARVLPWSLLSTDHSRPPYCCLTRSGASQNVEQDRSMFIVYFELKVPISMKQGEGPFQKKRFILI